MANGDLVEVTLFAEGPSGEELCNVVHYVQDGGIDTPTITQMVAAAGDFALVWDVARRSTLSQNCKLRDTKLVIITGAAAGQFGFDSSSNGLAGGSLGNDGPIERCILAQGRTGLIGRKQRARLYLPCPCAETFDSDGSWVPGNPDAADQLNHVSKLASQVDGTFSGIDWALSPVVFHRSTVTYTLIAEATLGTKVGIQRRRIIGVGA